MNISFAFAFLLTCFRQEALSFTPSGPSTLIKSHHLSNLFAVKTQEDDPTRIGDTKPQTPKEQRRVLGSQELLMLPRQYSPKPRTTNPGRVATVAEVSAITSGKTEDDEATNAKDPPTFPQMNHVSCNILSATPSESALRQAIDETIRCHPLLRAHVEGDGEPYERIDMFQMVRKGDPNPCTFVAPSHSFSSADVLTVVDVQGQGPAALDKSWQLSFQKDLDDGSWCDPESGPLWKVEFHRLNKSSSSSPCALLFSFNHAISDQSSANMMMDQILRYLAEIDQMGSINCDTVFQEMPLALEDSVLGEKKRFSDIQIGGFGPGTIGYIAGKAAEGFKNPAILPDGASSRDPRGFVGALTTISGNAAGGMDSSSQDRKSALQYRKLSAQSTNALVEMCRENGVTVTNALTAAMVLVSSDFIDGGVAKGKERNYKILQSLDMRRFGSRLDKGETVACMAGSMDILYGPIQDRLGEALRRNPSPQRLSQFWNLAQEGKNQTEAFISSDGPRHAVRVFDFAMSISDMNNLVHLTAESKASQGRAYSGGVSNIGVYETQNAVHMIGETDRDKLKTQHGRYEIQDIFFATSHARTGCLYQVSTMTVGGEMKLTFHPVAPIVDEETSSKFADAFVGTLEVVSGTRKAKPSGLELPSLPMKLLPTLTAIVGIGAIGIHAQAFDGFLDSVMEMRANVEGPSEFWAALNFWIFFAVGHPILQPILWISDVLHGSPGPKLADLVPYTFLAGNVVAIGSIAFSREIRNSLNIALLCAFMSYIGAGLDGQAGLSDYNLALDDPYGGKVVLGCPTYEEVRQPSMDGFDLQKYQGKWYEQKFHDWTQFKEVYDTTLDIRLTDGGAGWIDDFAVKGPSEAAAPLSWDKSPVANGAHYFLFGKVDNNDPPGVLRESGFGVTFPNYIVDIKKDPVSGEYTEAIQFQCLERGGVRVFEGINFLSRKPQLTNEELDEMHARAKSAGMYPYGATPEQMHTVARRPEGSPDIDNAWQGMWRAIGFDKLLELVTESIEDGGR